MKFLRSLPNTKYQILATVFVLFFLLATPVLAVAGPSGGNALNSSWFVQDPQTWQQQTFGEDSTQKVAF